MTILYSLYIYMPNSIEGSIGLSVCLQLNFKNIDIISKLLLSHEPIIYGLSEPIDRSLNLCFSCEDDDKPPSFDFSILQNLSGLKDEQEFLELSSKIAEISGDKLVLRKKIEYINFEDESQMNNYIEVFENYDGYKYDSDDEYDDSDSKEDSNIDTQDYTSNNIPNNNEIIDKTSNIDKITYVTLDMNIEEAIKSRDKLLKEVVELLKQINEEKSKNHQKKKKSLHDVIDKDDIYSKKQKFLKKIYEETRYYYENYDVSKISFVFFDKIINFDLNLSFRNAYDTDFGRVEDLSTFMNRVNTVTNFFTDLGIDKNKLSIFKYNTSERY